MAWLPHRAARSQLLRSIRSYSTEAGCFAGISQLKEPNDWFTFAGDAASKCQDLVNKVVTNPPSVETVRLLDDISDTLCQVLDAAEFCRNVHSSPEWRAAAEKVCIDLGSYVHELNTNYALYTALTAALPPQHQQSPSCNGAAAASTSNSNADYDEETLLVGRMLQRDFERYGVHLSGPTRDRVAQLVANTQALGFAFTQNIIDPDKCGNLIVTEENAKLVNSLPDGVRRFFRPWQNSGSFQGLMAPGTSSVLLSIVANSDAEKLRKEAYEVYSNHPMDNLRVLDELVASRNELAAAMGYESYAAYQLDGFSLAGIPEAVHEFLEKFSDAVRPAARAEAEMLTTVKRKHNTAGVDGAKGLLRPWDREWARGWAGKGGPSQVIGALEQYVTLDGAISGLSAMLESLMGVKLSQETPSVGEAWAPGVQKLVAHDSKDGRFLGVVYLDLYHRAGKFPGAAHFTLRCGRKLQDYDRTSSASTEYQTPIVALVANFRHDGWSLRLSFREIETFFHEFGHALNSLLSSTMHQHLSGTRGPQDVIEIPSHIFEHFATDPAALKLLAEHSSGNKAALPPAEVLAAAAETKREFAALTLQSALSMCLVDQLLHGKTPPVGSEAEKQIAQVMQAHNALGHVDGTHPYVRFNHLVGYGANYYCYLFAECISASLWESARVKTGSNTWPDGQILRRQVLEPGGAKIAHHYVSDLFKNESETQQRVLVPVKGGQGWYPTADSFLKQLGILTVN